MQRTFTLTLAGLLAAGTAFANPPELIPLEIPEARLTVGAYNAEGCSVDSTGHVNLANGDSAVLEGECPLGQPVSGEVALIGNAVVVTLPAGFDTVIIGDDLLGVTVPNLASLMPLVVGIQPRLFGQTLGVDLLGELGGVYAYDAYSPPVDSRVTFGVLGGDTLKLVRLYAMAAPSADGVVRLELFTAAPPSAISREEFDDLQQRLSRIESLPGIARRLALAPGLELALLLVPGAWLYHRRAGFQR